MEASSTIFWVFGMTRPGIELCLANTLTIMPIHLYIARLSALLRISWGNFVGAFSFGSALRYWLIIFKLYECFLSFLFL